MDPVVFDRKSPIELRSSGKLVAERSCDPDLERLSTRVRAAQANVMKFEHAADSLMEALEHGLLGREDERQRLEAGHACGACRRQVGGPRNETSHCARLALGHYPFGIDSDPPRITHPGDCR